MGYWNGVGISWTICKQSTPCSRLIHTTRELSGTTSVIVTYCFFHHHHYHHFICPIIQQYAHLHEYNSRRVGQQGPIWTLTAALKRSIKTVTGCIFYHTHTHTRLTALCPGLPRWAGTRKVKPIWILLEQEIVSGSGISWAVCKSAPHSRQITTPAPHHSVFYRPDALPAAQPTASKHWRHQKTFNDAKLSFVKNRIGKTLVN